MKDIEKSFLYTLARSRISSRDVQKILSSAIDHESLLNNPEKYFHSLSLNDSSTDKISKLWKDKELREKEFAEGEKLGIKIITLHDDAYPRALKEITNSPAILFLRGDFLSRDNLAVSIVGPRASTSYGRDVTAKIVQVLALHATVVSGMALGIDSVAHQKTIEADGRTIGVAGCGLGVDYPQGNRKLRESISEHGCLISAYPPLMPASRHHFPERNAIIAGLSQITIVVEASEKSGSLITARLAGEMGRDVAAVPGDITRRNSKGANQLIADGASIITDVNEVILMLERYANINLSSDELNDESETETDYPELWIMVLKELHHEPQTMDQLMKKLEPEGVDRGAASQAILEMEISGLIKQGPGGKYRSG